MSSQKTRGPHPKDQKLFGTAKQVEKLRSAVSDLSWLYSRDYPENAALKLVGDRYKLTKRQRMALRRCACSEQSRQHRNETKINFRNEGEEAVLIDGFNVIITVEASLSDGFLFKGNDGVIRDISGVHGSYRLLGITREAVEMLVLFFKDKGVKELWWYFDKPVSNSGRLRALTQETCDEMKIPAATEVLFNPDSKLIQSIAPVVTSDSEVLDRSGKWLSLEPLFKNLNKNRIINLLSN